MITTKETFTNTSRIAFISQLKPIQLYELYHKDNSLDTFDKKFSKRESLDYYLYVINFAGELMKNKGVNYANYKFSKTTPFGRLYADKGIQRLQKEIRGFMMEGSGYIDYDIKTCAQSVLKYLIKRDHPSSKTPLLDDYINNKQEVLKSNNITKLDVCKTMNKDRLYKESNKWLNDFHKEIKPFKIWYFHENKDLQDDTHKNKYSSLLNKLICKEEGNILETVISKLQLKDPVREFDGFHSQKEIDINLLNNITNKWGVKWDIKEPVEDPKLMEMFNRWRAENWDQVENIDNIDSSSETGDQADDEREEEETYENVKKKFEKNNFICLNPLSYITITVNDEGEEMLSRENKTNFINKYEPMDFIQKKLDKYGEMREYRVSFIDKWLKDKTRRSYRSVNFIPPPKKCPHDTFNLFTGFKYEKYINQGHQPDEDISIFLNHIKFLSGEEETEKINNYILNYLAHIIQKPGILPRTSLVFNSKPGYGKNILFDNFGREILGDKYHLSTSNAERFVGKWKSIQHKFIGVYNEASSRDTFGLDNKLKELITEPKVDYEEKREKQIIINNTMRLIVLTNKDNAIKIDPNDRRFQVVEITGEKPQPEYFNKLGDFWKDPSKILGVVEFLKNRNIEDFIPEHQRITTSLYDAMVSINIAPRDRFIHSIVERLGNDEDQNKFKPTELYELYKDYMKNNNFNPETSTMFGRKLKNDDWKESITYKQTKKGRFYIFNKEKLIDVLVSKKVINDDQAFDLKTDYKLDDDEENHLDNGVTFD